MTNDLSTRLLTAIGEREQCTRAVMDGAWTRWTNPDPESHHHSGINTVRAGIDVYAPQPEVGEAVSNYLEDLSPAAVLRLCQAHREIVRQFQRAWDRRDSGNEREVLIRQARAIAFIDVLHVLATAYGIQEPPGGGRA